MSFSKNYSKQKYGQDSIQNAMYTAFVYTIIGNCLDR